VPPRKKSSCPFRTRFGQNVSQLRQARGVTQEALAEQVGISARYEQSVEAGEYFPALPNLVKLKRALGVTWDDLFDGCD